MKCGLVGGSAQQFSLPFDAQRTVNLFPVLDQEGKDVAALYSVPGNALFGTAGQGPGRGGFASTNGRVFEISGSGLYELNGDGSTTLRGSLKQSQGIVTIDENGPQMAVCDGVNLYIFTYATNSFAIVNNPNLPSAASVTFIDGYFIVNRSVSSGIFQISGLYDGTSWDALDFATAESSPDSLLRVLNIVGQLWLFGAKTTEIWSNTGAALFPFAKIAGAKMETGIGAPYSAIPLDNSAFWVGNDSNGFGIVYRAQGFSPNRISTEPVELRLQAAPDPSTLRAWAYQEQGHTFYIITGGGMETALVYDLATKIWCERAFLNSEGNYELPLAAFGIYAFGKILTFDRSNGNIYDQSQKYFADNGEEIVRDRIFTSLFNENDRFRIRNLTVGFETGVGNENDPAQDPQAILALSVDGSRTWFGNYPRSLGKVGQYLTRVVWQRLGQSRQMAFRLRVTDPVKVAITGAWFNTGGVNG